ncbi:MAG TPA: efflux RND transporter periplasmic adaptor subunit [Longimicrobiales bacterium]|nr:efflux RND transporter periplasmic adaptor subunit [Longimicrobiales bacterium]
MIAAALIAGTLAIRAVRPPVVSTVTLEDRDVVRTLVLVGSVRPPSRAGLGATVAGSVREVHVREGDRVVRGQVLAVLEDREAQAAVAQAEAAVAEAAASARSAVQLAETEVIQAERDLDRIRAVFTEGARTRQQVDQAEQRAADARSRLEAARATADADAPPASEARARAALEAARARLALTRIGAPSDGMILTRSVEPGDAVQPGRVLLEMAFDGPWELVVFPAEENLSQIALGADATASADAYPGQIFPAVVSLIAPAVDPAQGTVEVRLSVPDAPDYLRASMTVSVNIEAGRRTGAPVLPEDAVRGLGTPDPWVAVVVDGRLARRPVEVGLRAERWVEIRSGLAPDDAVVPPGGSPDLGKRVRVARER